MSNPIKWLDRDNGPVNYGEPTYWDRRCEYRSMCFRATRECRLCHDLEHSLCLPPAGLVSCWGISTRSFLRHMYLHVSRYSSAAHAAFPASSKSLTPIPWTRIRAPVAHLPDELDRKEFGTSYRHDWYFDHDKREGFLRLKNGQSIHCGVDVMYQYTLNVNNLTVQGADVEMYSISTGLSSAD